MSPTEQPATDGAPAYHGQGAAPPAWAEWQGYLSRAALIVGVALLCATFLLMSPARGKTYPGAIPWGDASILRPLIDLMSFNGLVATDSGTEIKTLAFYLAAVIGLLLLALRSMRVGAGLSLRRRWAEPWLAAQFLLVGWVVVTAASSFWAGDAALARGQAAIYALAVAWAIGLAWTLEDRDVPRLLAGLVVAAALGAVLCIWHYQERNPAHRPGFPLGNPATLSAAILPAILIALAVLGGAVEEWRRKRTRPALAPLVGAAVALVPLLWCFALTNSRAALLGLAVGLLIMLFFIVGHRLRWLMLVGAVTVVALGGAWLLNASRLDMAMARGATIRFRVYAWRYAAGLWGQDWFTSALGQGAGQYPRLAGQYSLRDRSLDPVAFMDSSLVEHAHNELFEVLTEIGLIGGVTFVGGFLGTLVAGRLLVSSGQRDRRRWLHLALLAALAGLMTDAFFSPGLRLPGVPAVFYTIVGLIWAAGRLSPIAKTSGSVVHSQPAPRRVAGGVVALAAAVAAGLVTVDNWRGVLREEAAGFAFAQGDYDEAARGYAFAGTHLVDPVRQLINNGRVARARFTLAYTACRELAGQTPPPTTSQAATAAAASESDRQRQRVIERCQQAYQAAGELNLRAPTLMDSAQLAAGAAELLVGLYLTTDAETARQWAREASRAWRVHRVWRPYDFETLLALTHYNPPLVYHFGLLRDALRATHAYDRLGRSLSLSQMRAGWQAALQELATRPGFTEVVRQFLAVVGPVDPETDIDTLIDSRAPEVYRLAAHAAAEQYDFAAAQHYAARAARFYERMRPRLPTLYSIALLEQAEFALCDSPSEAERAATLLRKAIEHLPVIQEQKYEQLLRPFRRQLIAALLAGGDEAAARELVEAEVSDTDRLPGLLARRYVDLARLYLRQPTWRRPDVEPWLRAALRQQPDHFLGWSWLAWLAAERGDAAAVHSTLAGAARAGVASEDLQRIRHSLCAEFPALCEEIQTGD